MAKGIISGSMNRPVVTIIILLVVSFLFATRFPKMKVDADPENMLEKNEYGRVWNTLFALHNLNPLKKSVFN